MLFLVIRRMILHILDSMIPCPFSEISQRNNHLLSPSTLIPELASKSCRDIVLGPGSIDVFSLSANSPKIELAYLIRHIGFTINFQATNVCGRTRGGGGGRHRGKKNQGRYSHERGMLDW